MPEALRRGALVAVGLLVAAYLALYVVQRGAAVEVFDLPGVTFLQIAAAAVLGLLILRQQPRHAIGWIFIVGLALVPALNADVQLYSLLAHQRGLPLGGLAAWLGGWLFIAGLNLELTFMVLLFPDGRLPTPRWRRFAWALGIATGGATLLLAVGALPTSSNYVLSSSGAIADGDRRGLEPFELIVLILAVVCLISLIRRYRAGDSELRAQVRWFLAGAAVFAAALLTAMATSLHASGPSDWSAAVFEVATFAPPTAIAVAILRYRLYDIDVVISRTLVYGALAVFITGVYIGIVVGIGSLVGAGSKPDLGLSILATAVVAVAFQPLRERLTRVANRLIYGRRASPYEVLADFSRQVGASYAGEEALLRIAQVLADGTGAESAAVYVGERQVATYPAGADGHASGETRTVDVFHQGRQLGRLEVRKRRGEQLSPLEEKLLGDLAHQAGLVFSNVGLAADLRARLEELRASRQRLVQAQDEERRRLERNLHDGAQQHLVALKVRLGLAQALAAKDPARLGPVLAELQTEADSTLATMRELAHGIYPPLLAERGLKEALQSHARRATLPVSVDADGLGRYPQEVEAAIYFCCLEALQNVQKYAQASTATVQLWEEGGLLRFEVADDGVGFDPALARHGAGLTNLRDRLDALNGDLTIDSRPGGGTRLGGCVRLAPSRGEPVGAEL